ncbi:hypothetical protein OG302_43020 [Streptomyces sp. NBC_01283]|uniref:hypothetical protein n=1 Tax=Streptomyces sp. NBC_01283 TaxID=2903812 RepID=UPI00352CF887|nr:hypothetical protein OG302_43020 [Streptomyces sp. NBC_01283]
MVSKNKPPIVVLHDLENVRSEINAALETAGDNQRPGLQAALDILNRHAPTPATSASDDGSAGPSPKPAWNQTSTCAP